MNEDMRKEVMNHQVHEARAAVDFAEVKAMLANGCPLFVQGNPLGEEAAGQEDGKDEPCSH